MTLAYIILEGNKNQEILEKLLPKNLIQDVKIVVGESQYEVYTNLFTVPCSLKFKKVTKITQINIF